MTSPPEDVEKWAKDTMGTYLASVKWPHSRAKQMFMRKVYSLRNPSEDEYWYAASLHSEVDAVFVTIDRHGTLSTVDCRHFHYNWDTEPFDHVRQWIANVTTTIDTIRSASNIGCCMLLFGLPSRLPRYVFECLVGTLGVLFEAKFELFEKLAQSERVVPSVTVLAVAMGLYSIFADVVRSSPLVLGSSSGVPFGKSFLGITSSNRRDTSDRPYNSSCLRYRE